MAFRKLVGSYKDYDLSSHVLEDGYLAVDVDSGSLKLGDGSTAGGITITTGGGGGSSTSLGDLTADFGCNVKFIIGKKQKYKKLKFNNLPTTLFNKKSGQAVNGNTKAVYDSPLKSLVWLVNRARKDKVTINKNFYVFTGSTVGVVPILKKGLFEGQIKSLGTVKTTGR